LDEESVSTVSVNGLQSCTQMGYFKGCSSLHDPWGWARSLV